MRLTPVAKSESGRLPVKNNILILIHILNIHIMLRNVKNTIHIYRDTNLLGRALSLS